MIDPLLHKIIAVGLGLMFLVAAWHKAANGPQFRVTLLEYDVLPEGLVSPVSRAIPAAEFLLGIGWLGGLYQQWLTACGSALMMAIYAIAIGINLGRGRVHIDCGCGFGGAEDTEHPISAGLVGRNIVLAGLALVTLIPAAERTLGVGDYVSLVAALLAVSLLFGASNQLMANRAAINTWRKPRD